MMSSPEPAPYLVRRGAGAEEEGRRELAPPEPGDGGDEESEEKRRQLSRAMAAGSQDPSSRTRGHSRAARPSSVVQKVLNSIVPSQQKSLHTGYWKFCYKNQICSRQ